MTDVPSASSSVAGRLGVTARFVGDELQLELVPRPEVLHHGVVRASVLSFVVDAVAGIAVDVDPEVWTLTSDMSVRMRAMPAPACVVAVNRVLRQGRRSVTSTVEMTTAEGDPVASGAISFVRLARRPDDPPKPALTPSTTSRLFGGTADLDKPLREEAGIEVLDAAAGIVEVEVTPPLRNPAGTLQGAMVALLAEAAAEELVSARSGAPAVVTELDLRYVAQAPVGPVRTRSRLLGDTPDSPVEVVLVDTSVDRVTTLVYARAVPAP